MTAQEIIANNWNGKLYGQNIYINNVKTAVDFSELAKAYVLRFGKERFTNNASIVFDYSKVKDAKSYERFTNAAGIYYNTHAITNKQQLIDEEIMEDIEEFYNDNN